MKEINLFGISLICMTEVKVVQAAVWPVPVYKKTFQVENICGPGFIQDERLG